ncbi:MAG: response regulator, partial [Spirochaetia bacterium]
MSKKKKILLVEDDRIVSLAESAILTKAGYNVVIANSPNEAIAEVNREPVDLVLMDIDLGERNIDGTETAQIILENHDIPIVFCTGHSEKEYVDKVKGITRYGYVIKHSGEFVLLQSIDMAFELFEAHRNINEQKQKTETVNIKLKNIITELKDANAELKRKDHRLEKLNTALVTVSECNQILIRSQDEEKLIQEICATIIEKAGYRFAWVGYVDTVNEKRVVPIAHAGSEQGYLDEIE